MLQRRTEHVAFETPAGGHEDRRAGFTFCKPIIFTGPMVRAILDGRKTQTRRVINPQPLLPRPTGITEKMYRGRMENLMSKSPFKAGMKLWVRETFQQWIDSKSLGCVVYRADGNARVMLCDNCGEGDPVRIGGDTEPLPIPPDMRWRPAIHMPRWASRITLDITDVRVERLNSISSADCIAEGLLPTMRNETPAEERFAELWLSIHGNGSWTANPWVWVITFKKL